MIEFKVAAEAASVSEDEDVVEVPIEDQVYYARRPTTAQMALFFSARNKGIGAAGAMFDFVETLIGEEGREHIESLVTRRLIDMDDLFGGGTDLNPDGGLIDSIMEEFSGRPTPPSTGSSGSRPSGGRKSTGRSPGKGSTRSASPSTAS